MASSRRKAEPARAGRERAVGRASRGDADNGDQRARARSRRTPKVSEVVARELLEYILTADLEPGTQLPPESAMLETYEIGRGSLREALRILEVYGLISIRPGPGGGPVVEAVGPRELARLMMFYLNVKGITFDDLQRSSRLLQAAMAGEAARQRDTSLVARMQDDLDRAAATDEPAEYGAAIHDFHHALFAVPGGDFLGLIHDAVYQIILLRIGRRISVAEAREGLEEHQLILDAIADGDVEAASRLMTEHLEHVDARYERALPGLLEETITWA